jgi:hypothetical protein
MIFNEFSSWLRFTGIIFFFSFSANIIITSRLNSLVLEKYKLTDIICPDSENDSYYRALLNTCVCVPLTMKFSPVFVTKCSVQNTEKCSVQNTKK